jgi:hypothetical protein
MKRILFAAAAFAAAAGLRPAEAGEADAHRFSMSVKAQEIMLLFTNEVRLARAVDLFKETAIDKVYLETFRFGELVDAALLGQVKARFEAAGIETAGLVTPTLVGKPSTGWNACSCFTDAGTRVRLKEIFTHTARLFDTILIDDFWFTDCNCAECKAAEGTRPKDEFRRDLMLDVGRECAVAPARAVNPRVRMIVKYPSWHDAYPERGYDVARALEVFDASWVGTETRDYDWRKRAGIVPPAALFLMRWALDANGTACEGAWFDPLWTSPATYLEQARLTILGGARETLLHSYGYLTLTDKEGAALGDDLVRRLKIFGVGGIGAPSGPACFAALRGELPALRELARETARRAAAGIAAWKPVNVPEGNDARYYERLAMAGIPLAPCARFPVAAPAACFARCALNAPDAPRLINAYIATGHPTLVSRHLAEAGAGKLTLDRPNVYVIPTEASSWEFCDYPPDALAALRARVLPTFGIKAFEAPCRVGVALFTDGSRVLLNFADTPTEVSVNGQARVIPARGMVCDWK